MKALEKMPGLKDWRPGAWTPVLPEHERSTITLDLPVSTGSELRRFLCDFLHCRAHERPRLSITARFSGLSFTFSGDSTMDFKDTDLPGSVTFSVAGPVDAKGKPAKIDGVPVWALDDSTNAQITSQSADGLSCVVHLSDNPSATQLTVTADADLGAGVTTLQSQTVLNIVAGDAVSLGDITASAITPG